jgi:hypothetical protein
MSIGNLCQHAFHQIITTTDVVNNSDVRSSFYSRHPCIMYHNMLGVSCISSESDLNNRIDDYLYIQSMAHILPAIFLTTGRNSK